MKNIVKDKKIVIGNWKMNPANIKDAEKLFRGVTKSILSLKKTEVVICPPLPYIDRLKKISKKIYIGAQNSFGVDSGPFTGEVSPEMLYSIGVKYVILGHSERRSLGETNIDINKKIKGAIYAGLIPIICVGENDRDDNHGYFNFVKAQIEECLDGVSKNSLSKIIIAYEPVWAISTSLNHRDATSKDCEEMIIFIKKVLADKFGVNASLPRIIYGGSVGEKDAEEFVVRGGAEGLLVGKTSLTAKKFINIIKICETLNK
jgi:triosephosphate isomerase